MHDVLGPQHEVHGFVDEPAGGHVPFEHLSVLAQVSPSVLRPAALHDRDPDTVTIVCGDPQQLPGQRYHDEHGHGRQAHPAAFDEVCENHAGESHQHD